MEDIAGKLVAMDVYEPQTFALMVFGGFFIISSLVYLVSAFGTTEKSYEEAIAEQRAHMENEKHAKSDGKSKKKPFNARKKKKPESMQEAQVITPTPVVIPVNDVPVAPVKPQKVQKQSPKPKADSDAKPVKKAKSSEEKTTPKPKKEAKKPAPVVVEEFIQKAVDKQTFAAPPPPQPKKVTEVPVKAAHSEPVKSEPLKVKAKKETTISASSGSVKTVVATIKAARLNDKEIQQIVDTLLNKQNGSGNADQWTMANQRSDPMSSLKRQLQEKEQQLHNEILSTQASAQKVKEMRNELAQEKQQTMKSDMDHKTRISSLEKDIQALHLRMSQTHEQHSKEGASYQLKIKQLQAMVDESNSGVIQKLREENNMLKTEANRSVAKKEQLMGNELARLQAENSKLQSQLSGNKDHSRKTDDLRHNYESRIGQLEQQLQQVQVNHNEKENMLSKRLEEMSSELRTADDQKSTLARELEAAQKSAKMAATEADKTKKQFQELQKSNSGESEAYTNLESKLKDANEQNDELKDKLKSSADQLNSREKSTIEKEKQIQDQKNQISSLNSQVSELKKSLANKTESDSAINGQVKETESLLKEKESIITDLQEKVGSSQSELEKLKAEVDKQKKKNDALRDKNWKAMNAISASEKACEEKVSQGLKDLKDQLSSAVTTEQASARNTLKNLFPDVAIDSKLPHSEWLTAFELQAKDSLSNTVEESNQSKTIDSLNIQLSTAANEKTQLASQCQHYKKVLADTEKILNQLQASVQSEESKWHEKLTVAETELNQTKAELASLTDEIETAQQLREQADKNEQLNQGLLCELKASQEIIQELSQEVISVSNANDSTNNVLAEVQKQLAQVKTDFDTANQESVDKLNGEIDNLKTKLANEQEKCKKLSNDLSKASTSAPNNQLTEELDRAKEAEAVSKKKLSEVTAELEAARKVSDETAKCVEQLKKDLEAAKLALETANEQKGSPGDDLEVVTKELQETKTALQKEKSMTKELGTAAAKLQNMLKKNQTLLSAEREVTKDLKAKLGQLDAEGTSQLSQKEMEQQLVEAAKEEKSKNGKEETKSAEVSGSAV
ncbi:ribosome-binding protein 1-like isoform X4 [Antedon mediterranea]|uniref:ribosome-binding protein 1-like isoform X4 n=1 Tax=Antedon mediterranea TaxID=105859 RepID=UPI003AF6C4A0